MPSANFIKYDRNFFERLTPEARLFVILHEHGHYLYSDELNCDLFAANEMLKMGFNPSQIVNASIVSLGDSSHFRKQGLINYIRK